MARSNPIDLAACDSAADVLTALQQVETLNALMAQAAVSRDHGFGQTMTYSRKVFVPVTELCRDVCHYCTYAKTPSRLNTPYLSIDTALDIARQGAAVGCKEALLTLGERPEMRYRVARDALLALDTSTTLTYVREVADAIFRETGLLPHINAGTMSRAELAMLREVSASMGLMLESGSRRLCGKGMPHYGSPDKDPQRRIATLRDAGELQIPMTTGLLIGIGETREERVADLIALRDLHRQYGHLQELIIQNFRAKPETKMAGFAEPDIDELCWTVAVARLVMGPHMSIQVPPNLNPDHLQRLVNAGINDWGGVSPVTPDHVNPEAPWPHLDQLAQDTWRAGKWLDERLTLYPEYATQLEEWVDPQLHAGVLRLADGEGFAKDDWRTGSHEPPPPAVLQLVTQAPRRASPRNLETILERAQAGLRLTDLECARLFRARGEEFARVCQAADSVRRDRCGDRVSYVINRNINYTNICAFKCQFCAFSKGKTHDDLRGKPYNMGLDAIAEAVEEARGEGATEVCMQGGIHPSYTGDTYLDIVRTVKSVDPNMHVHAFSPLEVTHGAQTLGISVPEFLARLQQAGLDTLPGTAAEILDDAVRDVLCPDKLNRNAWLDVIESAHRIGLRTTATVMFGHVDDYGSWASHLLAIRDLQERTGGFTEFVPLPFVAAEAPIYRRGRSRSGPSFRESVLMHAVARLVFNSAIENIQASWVKMGRYGLEACLSAGVNDMGGTLMRESITRAAGAQTGQCLSAETLCEIGVQAGRIPWQRDTLYRPVIESTHAIYEEPIYAAV